MRKSVSAIGLLSLLFVFGAKAEAELNLASMDWSVKAPHNLAKEPPSRKVVEEFLQLGDDNANSPSLCSFTFADLRRNGTLTLLYASDSSGRGFCNEIEMVDRTGATFELSNLDTSEAFGDGDDVRKLVKDLDNNGHLELVVAMLIGGYQGRVYCTLEWPVIFAWTGGDYTDVSRQFNWFYRQRLAVLQSQLNEPPTTRGPEGEIEVFSSESPSVEAQVIKRRSASTSALSSETFDSDCTRANAAKTERFLGISREAGMDDAIRWSDSDDPLQREFAATVFDDIGTPEALAHLKNLASDSDPSIAVVAKDHLRFRAVNAPPATIYRFDTIPCQLKARSLSCDDSAH